MFSHGTFRAIYLESLEKIDHGSPFEGGRGVERCEQSRSSSMVYLFFVQKSEAHPFRQLKIGKHTDVDIAYAEHLYFLLTRPIKKVNVFIHLVQKPVRQFHQKYIMRLLIKNMIIQTLQ